MCDAEFHEDEKLQLSNGSSIRSAAAPTPFSSPLLDRQQLGTTTTVLHQRSADLHSTLLSHHHGSDSRRFMQPPPRSNTIQTVVAVVTAVILSCCTTNSIIMAEAAANWNLTVCFLFPNTLLDVGFTFNGNIARGQATRNLKLAYPNATITTHSMFECATQLPNFTTSLGAMIDSTGCQLVLSTTSECYSSVSTAAWTSFVNTYPSVNFVNNFPNQFFYPLSTPNTKSFGSSPWVAWYAAGAAAAAECTRCVGFVHPLTTTSPAVDAFYRGMKYGNWFHNGFQESLAHFRRRNNTDNRTMCPLIVTHLGSFLNVPAETVAAGLFTELGCEVIAYWTDSQTITKYVAALNNASLFTIANNIDAALIYGDSVLSSILVDLTTVMYNYMRDALLGNPFQGQFVTAVNGTQLGAMSPRTSRIGALAATYAFQSQLENNTMWCGGFALSNGTQLYSGCATEQMLSSFRYIERGIINYGRLASPMACPAGTYATYNATNAFVQKCVPCAPGTYSSVNGTLYGCSPCPSSYLIPNWNQTACVAIVLNSEGLSQRDVILVIVFSSLGGLLLIAFVVAFVWYYRTLRAGALYGPGKWQRLTPPSGDVVACIAIAVNSARSVEHWRLDVNFACSVFELLEDSVWRAAREHQGYVVFCAADVYIIVTPSVKTAVALARAVEKYFGGMDGHIALRMVINAGQPAAREAEAEANLQNQNRNAHHQSEKKKSMMKQSTTLGGSSESKRGRHNNGADGEAPNQHVLFNERMAFRGPLITDLLFAFANYKTDVNASMIALPGCFGSNLPPSPKMLAQRSLSPTSASPAAAAASNASLCLVDLSTLIQQQKDCLFAVAQWPAATTDASSGSNTLSSGPSTASSNNNAGGGGLQQVTTISTPEMALFLAASEKRRRKPPPGSSQGTDESSSTSKHPSADEWEGIVFDTTLVPDSQMMMILRYGTALTRTFLSVLEGTHRKQIVRVAAMRMHVRLNVQAARRKDPTANKVFFGEEQVVREIIAQVLRSLDEQQLQYWCKEVSQMR